MHFCQIKGKVWCEKRSLVYGPFGPFSKILTFWRVSHAEAACCSLQMEKMWWRLFPFPFWYFWPFRKPPSIPRFMAMLVLILYCHIWFECLFLSSKSYSTFQCTLATFIYLFLRVKTVLCTFEMVNFKAIFPLQTYSMAYDSTKNIVCNLPFFLTLK